MIRVTLTDEQRNELEAYRSTSKSENAERALMVLLSAEGKSPPEIARHLKRHHHTVRDWLCRYMDNGISGLDRLYAPGKTSQLRQSVIKALEEALEHFPCDYKYPTALWTTSLLKDWLLKHKTINASQDTIERALQDMDYSFCRSAMTVPENAPSKEEKLEMVARIINDIISAIGDKNCVVLALDESHFSTEPYVISGWQKKLWPPSHSDTKKTRKPHNIWLLELLDSKILLEEC